MKDSPKRRDVAGKVLKEMGAELKANYSTLGNYDSVAIVEAPNDEVMAKFTSAVCSLGNVRTTTMKAFPSSEFRKIIEALP